MEKKEKPVSFWNEAKTTGEGKFHRWVTFLLQPSDTNLEDKLVDLEERLSVSEISVFNFISS